MRRLIVCCLLSAVCCLPSCKKDDVVVTNKKVTNVHVVPVPTDASKAKLKATLPIDEMNVVERSALGTRVDAAGNVAQSTDTFHVGDPVYLTMWLKTSPAGLQTSVKFTDDKKKEVAWPRLNMHGEKLVTFKLDTSKLAPGIYHATCYWGMNEEREYDFEIQAKKKK